MALVATGQPGGVVFGALGGLGLVSLLGHRLRHPVRATEPRRPSPGDAGERGAPTLRVRP